MPFRREGFGRRLVGGLVVGVTTLTLMGLATSSSYAVSSGDDYPYRGLGQCPLVPLPPTPPVKPGPHPPGTQTTSAPNGGTTKPGQPTTPGTPGHPNQPSTPGQPNPPGQPVTPPVKAPPRVCAKHIWFINGGFGDPWGFALRNCTSFVAWRMRETDGVSDFSNNFGASHWGDAENWDDAARSLGYPVDHVPAVGAIAQTDNGRVGHVAWVSEVGDGTVTVEEYNYYAPGGYDVRTVPTTDFRYLHLADVSPAPTLGSTRAAVPTSAVSGHPWTARTTAQGDLIVRRPSGRPVRLGASGSWSPYAAPSVVTDALGRVWVAAVTRVGGLLTIHTSMTSPRLTHLRAFRQGGWSTTSSPVLAVDGQGRLRLFGVTATGDLWARRTPTPRSDHWGAPGLMGRTGSWSTHAAPAAAADGQGRLWLAAVTRSGSLQVRHTQPQGHRWTAFHALDATTWSITSTPALAAASDGRLNLASVTAHGALLVRHTLGSSDRWREPSPLGSASPYTSPALSVDANGRLWLASVTHGGRLVIRSASADAVGWRTPSHVRRTGYSVITSPSIAAPADGGVQVAALTVSGRVHWTRAGAPPLPSGDPARPHLGRFAGIIAALA